MEIDIALLGIGDDKAPGIDGLNAVFFKRSWGIIKHEVYDAVKEFLTTKAMFRHLNCTSVTLIPKVPNPTKVKDFRPIACCNVIYKIISKILTSRMQKVIGQEAQSGFIPERNISYNVSH